MWVYGIDMKYASVKIYVRQCYSVAGKLFLSRFDFLIFFGQIGFSRRFLLFLHVLTTLRLNFAIPLHFGMILMVFVEFQFYDFCFVLLSNFVSLSRHFLSRCLVVSSYFVSLSRPFLSRCLVFFVSLSRPFLSRCLVVSLFRHTPEILIFKI